MATLGYCIKDIKEELVKISDKNMPNKVAKLLTRDIQNGMFYSLALLKNKIADVYKTLGIKKTAKATDIEHYFEVRKSTKTEKDVRSKGYIIIRPRFIFK